MVLRTPKVIEKFIRTGQPYLRFRIGTNSYDMPVMLDDYNSVLIRAPQTK